ncbi:hypothetical protein Thiowin_02999 [Thiorhodovibrio winogradskyi]|uniref:Uncharacterized protein n=1 Tax=Thiorhodovibrio winogradskyi TaxID=77007 RepID=A0ABZ0SBM0_9GAMM|nr:hypothetical protein [Thiorhodovibrio winogradskyi]
MLIIVVCGSQIGFTSDARDEAKEGAEAAGLPMRHADGVVIRGLGSRGLKVRYLIGSEDFTPAKNARSSRLASPSDQESLASS